MKPVAEQRVDDEIGHVRIGDDRDSHPMQDVQLMSRNRGQFPLPRSEDDPDRTAPVGEVPHQASPSVASLPGKDQHATRIEQADRDLRQAPPGVFPSSG